ncbi:hypothetical protein H6G00_00355 [Leptolyngbya sp. FACHB-541]|uniref:hypothetical protein n=1 Tax=Leptolyngbya sp. FACHB-541 TaxID=2692810 RepID=UPI001689EDBA|nr:hypothetical protein [Leptolyngbya sp. FACHB-541]MBD1995080.1 hypothetical protein [Leptolyngbya sp. FACHB-541]
MAEERKRIYLNVPPEYEFKLLTALAFFLGRPVATQAAAVLGMYLRQSEPRIMAQVRFYGRKLGIDEYELLDLIFSDPDKVTELLAQAGAGRLEKIHEGDAPDIYGEVDQPE